MMSLPLWPDAFKLLCTATSFTCISLKVRKEKLSHNFPSLEIKIFVTFF